MAAGGLSALSQFGAPSNRHGGQGVNSSTKSLLTHGSFHTATERVVREAAAENEEDTE